MESIDPRTRFLYTPHTVTFLLLGLAVLIYVAHPFHPDPRPADPEAAAAVGYLNAKTGIWAIILVFLGYSVVQGPTPPMVRPHPAFWRLVHGIMVVYLLFMVYMLMQNVHDARQFLKHLYPELGVELPERHYGTDCRLWVPGEGVNWKVRGRQDCLEGSASCKHVLPASIKVSSPIWCAIYTTCYVVSPVSVTPLGSAGLT
jgi:phosphatidylserine synthase 2